MTTDELRAIIAAIIYASGRAEVPVQAIEIADFILNDIKVLKEAA